jgi:hypothetical protein
MGDGSWEMEDGSWELGVGRWEMEVYFTNDNLKPILI